MSEFIHKNFDKNVLYEATYNTTGIQDPIPLPYLQNGFTVQVTPTGGGAKVAASNDGVNWIEWDALEVTISTMSTLQPVRFVRVETTTATSCLVAIWGY
jgi:hypothetical protein